MSVRRKGFKEAGSRLGCPALRIGVRTVPYTMLLGEWDSQS